MNWRGILNTLGLWFAALVLVSPAVVPLPT